MTFKSEKEAYDTYNMYALRKGFGVRKDEKYMGCGGELQRCIFVCSCEGFPRDVSPNEERKIERTEIRCGCKARVRFKIENGVWEVIEYASEHNHPFIKEDQRHLIRSGRKIPESSEGVLSSMTKLGT